MKILSRVLPALLLAACAFPALADYNIGMDSITGAATRTTDLSRQMLVMVFGDVVNNPLQPTTISFIGQLYGVFNGIISSMAFMWFVAITLRAIVLSGNRGRVFGEGNTAMAPVSSLVGFMALVPTPSGWSISNLVFLWTASIMGVGSANLLVDKAADSIMTGYSMIVQPASGASVDAARGIFGMYICQTALNTEQAYVHRHGSSSTPPMSTRMTRDGREYRVSNGSATCGSAKIPAPPDNSNAGIFSFNTTANTGPIENAQLTAFTNMNATLSAAAQEYVAAYYGYRNGSGNKLPDSEGIIYSAAQEYERTITAAIAQVNDEGTIRSEMQAYLKQNGWIVLGAWYQSFATANNKTNEVAQRSPEVTGMGTLGEVAFKGLYREVSLNIAAQRQNSTYTPPLGSVNYRMNSNQEPTTANSALLSILPFAQEKTAWFINLASHDGTEINQQVNPLLRMKAIGDYTLGASQGIFTTYAAIKTYAAWGKGGSIPARLINGVTGAGDIANGALEAITPIVYFLLFILISIGFSLSIFLPFIPFIYWITACTSWMATVLIGTTAGTLWAWTHIGTEADKGSRAAYGYIFMIDAAIRPSLMVFGFFFASLVVVAIGTLLNIIMIPAMANVQADSITGLASFIGILMVYARLCSVLVSSAFSLQVYMPDYVIAWLGGREAAQIMKGAVESTRNMFAGFGGRLGSGPGLKRIQENGGDSQNGMK